MAEIRIKSNKPWGIVVEKNDRRKVFVWYVKKNNTVEFGTIVANDQYEAEHVLEMNRFNADSYTIKEVDMGDKFKSIATVSKRSSGSNFESILNEIW